MINTVTSRGVGFAEFRCSRAIEAVRGRASDRQICSKLANDFSGSFFIRETYAPVDLAAALAADEARERGRAKA